MELLQEQQVNAGVNAPSVLLGTTAKQTSTIATLIRVAMEQGLAQMAQQTSLARVLTGTPENGARTI